MAVTVENFFLWGSLFVMGSITSELISYLVGQQLPQNANRNTKLAVMVLIATVLIVMFGLVTRLEGGGGGPAIGAPAEPQVINLQLITSMVIAFLCGAILLFADLRRRITNSWLPMLFGLMICAGLAIIVMAL